jgi:RNA polymerase sigma-70 factor, ECF subfamily
VLADAAAPGPDVVAVATTEQALVRRALSEIKADDREVLMLAAWEGLTHAEIAEVVGCSLAAADKRVTRAKQRLADRYAALTTTDAAADSEPADPSTSKSSLVRIRRGGGAA